MVRREWVREKERERDCVPFYCTDVYAHCVFCLLITLCVLLWNISRSTFQMIENTDLYIYIYIYIEGF